MKNSVKRSELSKLEKFETQQVKKSELKTLKGGSTSTIGTDEWLGG